MWSSFSRAGLAVDAAVSGARGRGQVGVSLRALRSRADERHCKVRLADLVGGNVHNVASPEQRGKANRAYDQTVWS